MKDKINAVVVGYGGMGGYHADRISKMEKFNLLGVYDIKKERLDLAKERKIHSYKSLDDVLNDKRVELITIATYNESHKEIAIKAMQAGKNVISEKPVTLSSADLEEMIEASHETGMLFTVHQNRRWDDDYATIKRLYDSGGLGKVFAIDSRVYGSRGIPGDWRAEKEHGGGMVLDWGVHLLDQILMLTEGKKLLTVYATLTNITNYEVDDGFRAIMKFEDALEVLVEVYTNNFIGAPRWYMAGENGTAIIENWDLKGKIIKIRNWEKIDAVPIKAGTGLTKTMAPRTNDTIRRYPIKKVRVNWENYYDNIYDVIRNSAQQLITHDQLRRSMKLMEAIFESARRNEVIELNI
ncbi:MAG: putative oxidoreductase YvaA [Firmicutes bacterium ADurb.Bin300]|nr:MAG: putative oxidoreductase YvaA [Firmicutes bacterium ADurb.Bin300]HOD01770.1 Gfo/Idh/MocA family oxidoreductase [Clostridiales bacterium]